MQPRKRQDPPLATDSEHSQDIENVESTVKYMIRAFNAHDWNLLASFLASSFVCHSQFNPSRLFSKEEYLTRIRDACAMNPNRRTELPGQMLTIVEWSDGRKVLTVFGNVRQVGNSSQGDVARDGFHIMRFVRVNQEWLCQDMQGMSGCHYFDVPA